MPLNPPSKAHGFDMRSISYMKKNISISKYEKKKSWHPVPNLGQAPVVDWDCTRMNAANECNDQDNK